MCGVRLFVVGLVVSVASLKMPNCVWLIYPVAYMVGNTRAAFSIVCIVFADDQDGLKIEEGLARFG